MPYYQKMYHSLFNDVSDAIIKLQGAQRKIEELYMSSPETILTQIPGGGEKEPDAPKKGSPPHKKQPQSRGER
ncbi:MAG: hypothetical protein AAGU32_20715 [Bacillota bacterium]